MSFGSQFLAEESRLQPNLNKLYFDLVTDEVQQRITSPDPVLHARSQHLGRLFEAAPDDPLVVSSLHSLRSTLQDKRKDASVSYQSAQDIHAGANSPPDKNTLTLTETLQREAIRERNRNFTVPDNQYGSSLQAANSKSVYITSTPKMWPSSTQYTRNAKSNRAVVDSSCSTCTMGPSPLISDHPCSKSVEVSSTSSMSALQETLHRCGRLRLTDNLHDKKEEQLVQSQLRKYREKLHSHVDWLRGSNSRNHFTDKAIDDQASLATNSTFSSAGKQSCMNMSTSSKSVKSGSVLQSIDQTDNPFRRQSTKNRARVTHCRNKPRAPNDKDPTDYKHSGLVRSMAHFNAIIQPDLGVGKVPSKSEVDSILSQLTRKQILHFKARIVESAALLRALKHSMHETPGLQAILSLHQDFLRSSVLSINTFLLSKHQIFACIRRQVPWLEEQSISRLLSSFDTTNTGIIRFVRIVCTLMCVFQPAMTNLAGALDRNRQFWSKYVVSEDEKHAGRLTRVTGTKTAVKLSPVALSEAEWLDYRGEILLIRMLHGIYAECEGFVVGKVTNASRSCGDLNDGRDCEPQMRLEDVRELFGCCVSSLEDEHTMERVLQPMLEQLFQELHSHPSKALSSDSILASTASAESVLSYTNIKSLFARLMLTVEQLVDALLCHPTVLREFIRQVRKFRAEAQPFMLSSTTSIDDALSLHSKHP